MDSGHFENRSVLCICACVEGSGLAIEILTSQAWSVRPRVRPVGAVHMTAGHKPLLGSGSGQHPAFDNALAQVGCPDRQNATQHGVGSVLPSTLSGLIEFRSGLFCLN
jgi:hypothetical protein